MAAKNIDDMQRRMNRLIRDTHAREAAALLLIGETICQIAREDHTYHNITGMLEKSTQPIGRPAKIREGGTSAYAQTIGATATAPSGHAYGEYVESRGYKVLSAYVVDKRTQALATQILGHEIGKVKE